METKGYTLCAVRPGAAYNRMRASLYSASAEEGLPGHYTSFVPIVSEGAGFVAAYASSTGQVDVYARAAARSP